MNMKTAIREPKTMEEIQAMLDAEREARKSELIKNYPAVMTRKSKIRYYGNGSTNNAKKIFKNLLKTGKFGKVTKVQGDYSKEWGYRVRFFHESGHQSVFDGFSWWYGGQGSHALAECLDLIGVPKDICRKLETYSDATHGNQYKPNCFFLNLA